MPYKQLFFRAEAREKIVRGAAALADAVRGDARAEIEMCTDWQEMGPAARLQ